MTCSVIYKASCGGLASLLRWGNLSCTLRHQSSSLLIKIGQGLPVSSSFRPTYPYLDVIQNVLLKEIWEPEVWLHLINVSNM